MFSSIVEVPPFWYSAVIYKCFQRTMKEGMSEESVSGEFLRKICYFCMQK